MKGMFGNVQKRPRAVVSNNMSKIRSAGTGLEARMASLLDAAGFGYTKQMRVEGKPDFAFPEARIAIFCDSHFWHGLDWVARKKTIKSHKRFWIAKIERNMARDAFVNWSLTRNGWKVIRFWEKDIRNRPDWCLRVIRTALAEREHISTLVAVDFACGAGGTTKGLQIAGVRVAKGIDIDPSCEVTYETNCAPAAFKKGDIRTMDAEEVLAGVEPRLGENLLFSACLPCQPFSRQGKLNSADERVPLALSFLKLVGQVRPGYIFLENVPGFQEAWRGRLFREFRRGLKSLGYKYTYRVVDMKRYGLPQKRRRFILLASLFGKPVLPAFTHGARRLPFRTVRDAIAKYPRLSAGGRNIEADNHECQGFSDATMKRMKATPKNGGSRKDWPTELVLKCHGKGHTGHWDVYGRMSWDKPAPTLTTRCISFSNGRFGHPSQNRAISVREAATLQGFGDDFLFSEPMTVAAKHIGNAVPPTLVPILIGGLVSLLPPSSERQPLGRLDALLQRADTGSAIIESPIQVIRR
jgi:DNA (cytosine-5)-methyltransferase 1